MESKLLLVEKGTSVHDLEFVNSILAYYGFSVKEFPCGYIPAKNTETPKTWQQVYDKEI